MFFEIAETGSKADAAHLFYLKEFGKIGMANQHSMSSPHLFDVMTAVDKKIFEGKYKNQIIQQFTARKFPTQLPAPAISRLLPASEISFDPVHIRASSVSKEAREQGLMTAIQAKIN